MVLHNKPRVIFDQVPTWAREVGKRSWQKAQNIAISGHLRLCSKIFFPIVSTIITDIITIKFISIKQYGQYVYIFHDTDKNRFILRIVIFFSSSVRYGFFFFGRPYRETRGLAVIGILMAEITTSITKCNRACKFAQRKLLEFHGKKTGG